nr:putative phosphoenolpyruvate synthase [Megalopta genalis]
MDYVWFIIQITFSIGISLFLYLTFSKIVRKNPLCFNSIRKLPSVNYLLKYWLAEFFLRMRRKKTATSTNWRNKKLKTSRIKDKNSSHTLLFYGADQAGNSLLIKFSHRGFKTVEATLHLTTSDGRLFVLPGYPDTTVVSSFNQEWATADLKIEVLKAHQRWRIIYNGMLRDLSKGDECNDKNVQHVRLNFLFIVNSVPLRWPEDWSLKLHADVLAREPWRSPKWMNKIRQLDYTGTDYIGSLLGEVRYNDGDISALYLRGLYQHRWGKHESCEFKESVTLFGATKFGALFYLNTSSTKHSFPTIQCGQLKDNDEAIREIESMGLTLADFMEKKLTSNSEHRTWCKAGGKDYDILMKFNEPVTLYHGQPWDWKNKIIPVKLEFNGRPGVGLLQLCNSYDGPSQTTPSRKLQLLKQLHVHLERSDYVVFFDNVKCQNENITGGKGFSLAILTSIKDAGFIVPKGFCITVFGLELQLHTNKELQGVINDIEHVSVGKKTGDLQEYCHRAVRVIQSAPIVDEVRESILEALNHLEAEENSDKPYKYAIRSSAVGEDSEETSAAGQNATYLGVQGADNIIKSVSKCWASLYSYQSVIYRKQHGMFTKSSMGVCVQLMVDADAAGVMFTRHPTTGDPSNIVITANYGLGETVVSAAVEPDTIIVHKSWDDKLTMNSTMPGSKQRKMLTNDDGLITIDLSEQERKKVCISGEIALRLTTIGTNLESLFGSARDIEWAVVGEQIYLLQARPITTLYNWTDFELIHELDTVVPSDIDILSFANVGEVMPGPMSPLTISMFVKPFNDAANPSSNIPDANCFNVVSMRCTLNYYNLFVRQPDKEISLSNKVCDIALCGHIMITPEIHKVGLERNGLCSRYERCFWLWMLVKDILQNGSVEPVARQLERSITFNLENFYTAYSLYNEINKKISEYIEMIKCHSLATRGSVIYQMLMMAILTNGYDDIVPHHYSDIAVLLGTVNDIVSGQVVVSLKKIVKYLKACELDDEFKKLDPTKAIDWMKINCPPASKEFENVLKEHGHRCIQELDLMMEPWSLRPDTLITTLQTMVSSANMDNTKQKKLTAKETVALLKTPKSEAIRSILNVIVPLSRKSVTRRELTKSLLVNVVHKFRLAFKKLGKLMVLEEYLPNQDLIFFLTIDEIREVLNHRNKSLVQRVVRRHRLYPKLKQLRFPEVNTGMPLPIKNESEIDRFLTTDGSIKIQGTAVCTGSALNRACVITDLSETHKIQSGDILITFATDIAWSPFFTLLSGIVTELGGIISHGAVVAREYGLPCIVGARGATQLFKTGDTVLLVADTGVLELVKRYEENENPK